MILIGLGANLPSPRFGPPRETLVTALDRMNSEGIRVVRRSRFYRTAPVPSGDDPWYVNAVAAVVTSLGPVPLLNRLLAIEADFGRVRSVRNAPRVLDLDLLAYGEVATGAGTAPELPHPRLTERAFVLLPLAEVAPDWRHPVSGAAVRDLIALLPPDQVAEPDADLGRGEAP